MQFGRHIQLRSMGITLLKGTVRPHSVYSLYETNAAATNSKLVAKQLRRHWRGISVWNYKQPTWIIIIAVIFVCLWSCTAWCQYAPTSGPYKVLTIENISLHDSARNKDIPIKIYYPGAAGRFPVIIFSHGALASKDNY